LHEIPLADLEMSGKNIPIFRQWMPSSPGENRFAVSVDEVISIWGSLRNFLWKGCEICTYAYEIFWQSL